MNAAGRIKEQAKQLGFSECGISKAEKLTEEEARLSSWLKRDMHGQMDYMAEHFAKRLDPTLLVPGAKSVISLLYNYYPLNPQTKGPKIARYAYGKDYHYVIKDKLRDFLEWISQEIAPVKGRVFVDSAPVMERAWAAKSGLGWIGKNSLLLNHEKGSYFFLAELIINLELPVDGPVTDHCGSCTACIDACPTDAITPYEVDGSKCISYFTIELKENESIPTEMKGKFDDWAFGCDICQEVCPWNKFSKPHQESAFEPSEDFLALDHKNWNEMTKEVFGKIFKDSPLQRAKFGGMQRNVEFLVND